MRKLIRNIITVPFVPILSLYWILLYIIGYEYHIYYEIRNGDNE